MNKDRTADDFVSRRGVPMQEKTYVITEIVGVSDASIAQAVANAVARANQTLKALDWFELKEVRGTVVNGKVDQYQVTLDVAFRFLTDEEMRAWAQG
jgi:flavin-binding protein dodecin